MHFRWKNWDTIIQVLHLWYFPINMILLLFLLRTLIEINLRVLMESLILKIHMIILLILVHLTIFLDILKLWYLWHIHFYLKAEFSCFFLHLQKLLHLLLTVNFLLSLLLNLFLFKLILLYQFCLDSLWLNLVLNPLECLFLFRFAVLFVVKLSLDLFLFGCEDPSSSILNCLLIHFILILLLHSSFTFSIFFLLEL